jgi:hypothetical protein
VRALLAGGSVVSLVETGRVVALEMDRRETRTLREAAAPIAIARHTAGVAVLGADGSVAVLALDGSTTPGTTFTVWPRSTQPLRTSDGASLLTDRTGALVAAVAGRGLALLDPGGNVRSADPAPCTQPASLVPTAGPGLVVVCGEGVVALVGKAD